MRTLLWIFLMFVHCNLWAAANGGAGDEPARAGAGACERPDSPDDYKFSTLADAVEFCQSIARDNIIWIEGLQAYWAKPENVAAVQESIYGVLKKHGVTMEIVKRKVHGMLEGYTKEKETWAECLSNAECLLEGADDPNEMPTFLNEIIEILRVRKKDLSEITYGATNPDAGYTSHLFPGNLENTQAQWESLYDIFKLLIRFSTPEYQADYAMAHFEYQGSGRYHRHWHGIKALDVSEKCAVEGKFFTIVTPSGQHIKLPLEKELSLESKEFIGQEWLAMGIKLKIGELKIKFMTSQLEFILNMLPIGYARKYETAYRSAKAAYEAEVRAAKAGSDLLKLEGDPSKLSKNARKAAAREAAAQEKAKREAAAAREAARIAAEAVASKAALAAERARHAALSLALVGAQKPLPSLEKASGAAATESVPPIHREPIGSIPLKPELQSMLSALIMHAAPVRSYNWHQLENLLGNLGFTRRGTNFVGFDDAGKRKQIGLHYLHNRGGSLNPDLVQIMFRQLHGSIGLGRAALGRLAGIAESLPWPWESDRRG